MADRPKAKTGTAVMSECSPSATFEASGFSISTLLLSAQQVLPALKITLPHQFKGNTRSIKQISLRTAEP